MKKENFHTLSIFFKRRPFTLQEQYVRIGKVAAKPLKSVAELKAAS